MQLNPGIAVTSAAAAVAAWAQAVAVATAVSAAVAVGSVAAVTVAAVAVIGPRDLTQLCFVVFSCDKAGGNRVCRRLGAGWGSGSGVQSGHSQATVRSQSGLQSGHSQVL